DEATEAVTARFYQSLPSAYLALGVRGNKACKEDIGFHIEFFRSVLEFGLLEPYIAYLRWLCVVLGTRNIPHDHVALSLEWLEQFYADRLRGEEAETVTSALRAARLGLLEPTSAIAPGPA